MRFWSWLLLLAAMRPGSAAAQVQVTVPYPGVRHEVHTDAAQPLVVHLILADVSSQEIHLYATQSSERGQTVSAFADCQRGTVGCAPLDVAVNGAIFSPLDFRPEGLAIGATQPWSDAASDDAVSGFFAFGRPADVNAVHLSPPASVEAPPAALAVEGALAGRALLVRAGQPQAQFEAGAPNQPYRLRARTALGLDAGGRTLFIAVAEGNHAGSPGITSEALGRWLAARGVADALELDGGGASALYVRGEGGLVSRPSDGAERPVANHLGLRWGRSPYRASVTGFVFDSKFGDMTKVLTNATVTVDGRDVTWLNGHRQYTIDDVTPHFVCARASAPGFVSAQQCRQITAADIQTSQIQYLSLVLFPGVDPPDMAAAPDLAAPADLSLGGGGGGGADGSPLPPGTEGCTCSVGTRPGVGTGFLRALVLFLVAGALATLRRSKRSA
jgi:hypothetical protein